MSLTTNNGNYSVPAQTMGAILPSSIPSQSYELYTPEAIGLFEPGVLQGRFIQAISKTFEIENKTLEPLKQFLSAWSQDVSASKATLKESGYLWRIFSGESFEEWLEYQNELGRVTSLFSNLFDHPDATKKLMKQLNPKLIEAAIAQATQWQKDLGKTRDQSSCSSNLLMGGVLSLSTQNPIPIALSSLSCIKASEAAPVKFNDHIGLEPQQTWYMEAHHKIVLCKYKPDTIVVIPPVKYPVFNGPFRKVTYVPFPGHSEPVEVNKGGGCNYSGPNLKVTIVNMDSKEVLYNGPFGHTQEFNTAHKAWDLLGITREWYYYPLSILIENTSKEPAGMYVFVE